MLNIYKALNIFIYINEKGKFDRQHAIIINFNLSFSLSPSQKWTTGLLSRYCLIFIARMKQFAKANSLYETQGIS